MKKIYDRINYELFDGLLPDDVQVQCITEYQSTLAFGAVAEGLCNCQDDGVYFIGISDWLTDREKFNTLIHEMIHVWQWENKKPAGHSGWFRVWCDKAIELYY